MLLGDLTEKKIKTTNWSRFGSISISTECIEDKFVLVHHIAMVIGYLVSHYLINLKENDSFLDFSSNLTDGYFEAVFLSFSKLLNPLRV